MTLYIWWWCMLFNSAFNIYLWRKKMNGLAFCYVFTNIYRSTFPVMHYTNTCMFEICSPLIERSLSTVAELAFTIQILKYLNVPMKYRLKCLSSIAVAEIFCWAGIITGYSYLHALEENIWLLNAIFILNVNRHNLTNLFCLYFYIIYMIMFDIPMYINRPNSIKNEILICENISTDPILWYNSLIWMTGYFTFGSWVSLAISS
jgi:hypothetical protein